MCRYKPFCIPRLTFKKKKILSVAHLTVVVTGGKIIFWLLTEAHAARPYFYFDPRDANYAGRQSLKLFNQRVSEQCCKVVTKEDEKETRGGFQGVKVTTIYI